MFFKMDAVFKAKLFQWLVSDKITVLIVSDWLYSLDVDGSFDTSACHEELVQNKVMPLAPVDDWWKCRRTPMWCNVCAFLLFMFLTFTIY